MPAKPASAALQNYFLDTILGKFATRIGLMDSILNVVWDPHQKTALILMRPCDPEAFDELKELAAETLREVEEVHFDAKGQMVRFKGAPCIVLKIVQKDGQSQGGN